MEKNVDSNYPEGLSSEFLNKIKNIQKNATKQTLMTHSMYDGIWLDSLQCMDGHGVYTYPDGSEYRGYFRRGHFHGYGTLHLVDPYNFTFKGTFIDGHLNEIDEMWFDDGLCVSADIDGWSMDFSSWKYCSKEDRRYAEEQREGLQPIGPFSRLTPQQPPRNLYGNHYDTEEGIYNPTSGLLTQRPAPFPSIHFVACRKDIEWILNNCRHGPLANRKVDAEVWHKIIRNNLNSEIEMAEHVPSCNYDQDKNRKLYFAKLCQKSNVGQLSKDVEDSEDSVGSRLRNSSSTCSSFSTTSMDVDVQEVLFLADEYDHYKLGRNMSQETSVMVKDRVATKI
ncbi:uncharacterized protein LOC135955519 [Calliphora vicina]|uniref:uncharacterized protein LOC135955519 n=1 Tax=Calliphora vicina TaxID=7373 RepID=UPI00325B252A